MARKSFVFLVVGTVIFFLCSISSADIPHMINYQGKLTTPDGGCLNDTVQMTFSIYPDTLGSPADWTETQIEVVVKEGIFNVLLGAVDTIPQAVFVGNIKYLVVQVESDPEMRPLKPMVSIPYAYRVGTIDGATGGTIEGNVNIQGDVIITGDTIYVGDILIEPTTRYLSIPSTEFRQVSKSTAPWAQLHERYDNFMGFIIHENEMAVASGPIQLPHGAIISKAIAYYSYEGASSINVAIYVGRTPLFQNPGPQFESVDSTWITLSSSVDYDSLTLSSFWDPTIDNTRYCYAIRVEVWGNTTTGTCRIYGSRIQYVIDKPLP